MTSVPQYQMQWFPGADMMSPEQQLSKCDIVIFSCNLTLLNSSHSDVKNVRQGEELASSSTSALEGTSSASRLS